MCSRLRSLLIGLAVGVAGVLVGAQSITIPNTFVNGTVADATQVNANFSALSANALNRGAGVFNGDATPDADDTRSLGTNALRFSNIRAHHFAGTGADFTGDGSALTAINASNVSSGTLAIARFPTGGTWTLASGLTLSGAFDLTYGRSLVGPAMFANGNSGSSITINFTTNGAVQSVVRTASCTYTLTAPASAGFVTLKMIHENSASVYTVTFSPVPKYPGASAPTWTNTANAVDMITFYYDGSTYYAVQQANFG